MNVTHRAHALLRALAETKNAPANKVIRVAAACFQAASAFEAPMSSHVKEEAFELLLAMAHSGNVSMENAHECALASIKATIAIEEAVKA